MFKCYQIFNNQDTNDYYIDFLENIIKQGLPKKDDIFDFAALCVLRYEKISKGEKMKQVQERHLKKLHRFDTEEVPPPPVVEVLSPKQAKGKRAKSTTKEVPESPKGKGKGKEAEKGKGKEAEKGKGKETEKGKGKGKEPEKLDKNATQGKGKGKRGNNFFNISANQILIYYASIWLKVYQAIYKFLSIE